MTTAKNTPLTSCCAPSAHDETVQLRAAVPHKSPAAAACCTVPGHHHSHPREDETLTALDEIRSEEIPADVAAIRAAGFMLLLETGQPVTVADLVAVTDIPADRVAEIFEAVRARGRIELDGEDRLIGLAGLTLTPGRHELIIDGTKHWTWCALDAVGIFGALEATGTVRSADAQTGVAIEITFVDGRPETDAHLFILGGYAEASVRQGWCPQVNFFASRHAADRWVAEKGLRGDVVAVAAVADEAATIWQPVVDGDAPQVC